MSTMAERSEDEERSGLCGNYDAHPPRKDPMVDRRERAYLLREGHLLGASIALGLHGFVHPYAATAYVLILLGLWLWSMVRHV